MIKYTAPILRFEEKGEKTGWTYVEVAELIAEQLNPGFKKSFRVKGMLDKYEIAQVAIMPMGDGSFILPINTEMRKGIGKRQGWMLEIQIEYDPSILEFSPDLLLCLEDDPVAMDYFNSLPPSHKRYYSKWIDSAKGFDTKSRRISLAIAALSQRKPYNIMMREQKELKG